MIPNLTMFSVVALFLLASVHHASSQVSIYGLGLLVVEIPEESDPPTFCTRYYPQIHNFSATRDEAETYSIKDLLDLKGVNLCDRDDIPKNVKTKFALGHYYKNDDNSTQSELPVNCSIIEKARMIMESNGTGLLMDTAMGIPKGVDPKPDFSFPVAALFSSEDRDSLLQLADKHPDARFLIYAPESERRSFDASLLVILFMAVFTIMIGSFWSGIAKHHLRSLHSEADNEVPQGNRVSGQDDEERIYNGPNSQPPVEEVSLRISPILVVVFVVCMCTMLILLYFFFDKLVYVIIGMFCLASTIAVYSCFEPLIMWTYEACPSCPTFRLPRFNLYICVTNLELRQFLLLAFSTSVTVVWAVYRNENWAWILQDILGVLFSINMLKVLRLPSLKICTLLLSALFIYDIFFVFITPLITKDGKSVMVEVATGGDTGEQLPMVLKVPHLGSNPLSVCMLPYSMLGFGDILVPGLLVSYCHSFDLLIGTPYRIYWMVTNIAYLLGLVATFVSLYVMSSAQPALLYLVPFTLIPVFIVALIRGDFAAMWQGDYEPQQTDDHGPTLKTGGDSLPEPEPEANDSLAPRQN